VTDCRAVAFALILASLLGACGARSFALVDDVGADAGPDSAGPDASVWVDVGLDCFCPEAELYVAGKDGTGSAECRVGGRVAYLIGNCGDSAIPEPVTVEYWAGIENPRPDDPQAARIQSQSTAAGMPAHFGQWVVFELTPEQSNVIHSLRDSIFVWIDPADIVPECNQPGSLDNVLFDGIPCVDPG